MSDTRASERNRLDLMIAVLLWVPVSAALAFSGVRATHAAIGWIVVAVALGLVAGFSAKTRADALVESASRSTVFLLAMAVALVFFCTYAFGSETQRVLVRGATFGFLLAFAYMRTEDYVRARRMARQLPAPPAPLAQRYFGRMWRPHMKWCRYQS
jgi:FtsH-binding integral membrane protein